MLSNILRNPEFRKNTEQFLRETLLSGLLRLLLKNYNKYLLNTSKHHWKTHNNDNLKSEKFHILNLTSLYNKNKNAFQETEQKIELDTILKNVFILILTYSHLFQQ